MKLSKIVAGLFALMGFVLAIAVAGIAISLRETSPVLLGEAQGPVDTAVEMMEAVCNECICILSICFFHWCYCAYWYIARCYSDFF